MRSPLAFAAAVMLLSSIGCGLELTKPDGDRRQAGGGGVAGIATSGDMAAAPANTDEGNSQPSEPTSNEAPVEDTGANEQPSEDSSQDDTVLKTAKVGVGKKGRYEGSGLVVTPLKAYFRSKERMAYDIQVPQALQLYQATNGHYPKTQEEFDTHILEANNIKLPELPPGHRYIYDPQSHQLMVGQPAP
jgi:hypothetical protein